MEYILAMIWKEQMANAKLLRSLPGLSLIIGIMSNWVFLGDLAAVMCSLSSINEGYTSAGYPLCVR